MSGTVKAEGLTGPTAQQSGPIAPADDLRRFFRHSGVYAVGNTLNRVGAFVLLPIYTNYLTVAEYGVLELYYAIGMVVSGILSVGIAHATLRFYFEYESDQERQQLVSTNLLASLAIGMAGTASIAVATANLPYDFMAALHQGRALHLVLATLVFELGSQVCLAYLRAREQSILFVVLALAKMLLQVALNSILLIRYDAGVDGVLAGNLATVVLAFVVLASYTILRCGIGFHRRYLLPVFKYSLPFLFMTVLGIAAANVDRFLIGELISLEALGVYALALRFAALIGELVGEPFNRAYGAFRFTIMDHPNAARLQADIVRYLLLLLAAGGLGVAYFAGDVIRLLAGEGFWTASALIPLLVLAAALQVASYPLQTGVLVSKATEELFYISVVNTVVRLAGGYFLITWLGLTGACLALVIDALIGLILTHLASQRYFRVVYDLRRIALLLVLCAGFFAAAEPLLTDHRLPAFAAKCALYLLFLSALMFSPVLDRDERRMAKRMVAGFLGRLHRKSGS